jgi:lipoprotein-anchoring transpeptidase ErfK/SrfK
LVRMSPFLLPPLLAAALAAWPLAAEQLPRASAETPNPPPSLPEALDLQVRLDRAGFSPGEIDGLHGANTERALAAMLKAGKSLDQAGAQVLMTHVIAPDEVAGPFTESIPDDLGEQAKLPALNYRSPLEALAERYHVSPALMQKLNPGVRFAAGETIRVPNVTVRELDRHSTSSANVTVVVSKSASSLTLLDDAGGVMFHAPVSSGSEHDPLPIGAWTVTAVSRNPTFHYNPDLFWDADPTHAKAKIPPGPNNPVGVVWIDISREHYGIHGTPEPSTVGHAQSHGCVRLTNWDAAYVTSLVKKGTPVLFEP